MARAAAAEPPRPRLRLDGAAAARLAAGFALGLAFWFAFSAPYERAVAAGAQTLTRLVERPATTSLAASEGEFRLDRSDFPADSPRICQLRSSSITDWGTPAYEYFEPFLKVISNSPREGEYSND